MGNILWGKWTHNGITQSQVLPCKFVENVTRMVSISSMRQLFACICEGKNQLTNRKILTHQALYGFDNKPQHNPTKDYKTSMQKLQKLSKKVSKLFNGMVMSLTIQCCCGVVSRTYEGMRSWAMEPTCAWEVRAPGVACSKQNKRQHCSSLCSEGILGSSMIMLVFAPSHPSPECSFDNRLD